MKKFDVAVIGAGIIGLSTAMQTLQQFRGTRLVVLDKENSLAAHQTGRNSGVLHSGIYYAPGSLKARFAVAGRTALVEFAEKHSIPHAICGKVVVACTDEEMGRACQLAERGEANRVPARLLPIEGIQEIEPNVCGVAGLHVPSTGIIDYVRVCEVMADEITKAGGEILLGHSLEGIHSKPDEIVLRVGEKEISCRYLVNCAGLYSDRIAHMSETALSDVKIVPFRGEYYTLVAEQKNLVRNLVYPVPNPSFPFLGVHFTRLVHGGMEVGPNAVPAFAREGYRWRDIVLRDITETLLWPGFRKLASSYWKTGLGEIRRSVSKHAFVHALQRIVPAVRARDLVRAPAGVRAQALTATGVLVDDFTVMSDDHMVHVVNAPSPAATASLPIGAHIAGILGERMALG